MRRALWAAVLVMGCHGTRAVSPLDAEVEPARAVPLVIVEAEPEPAPQEEGFAADALLPCTKEADVDPARHTLHMLGARIDGLDDGPKAPVLPVLDALRALLVTPCFELAAADLPDELEFDSGLALKTWWNEGGFDALYYYVAGRPQLDQVVTPAAPQRSFFLEGNEGHPLAPLLCASTDKACARGEAAGWYLRATTEFQQRMPNRDQELDKCADEAKTEELTSRWAAYRSCRLSRTAQRTALPLGRYRAPSDGVLAIANFGHGSCGTISTYDLTNGTVIHAKCNGSTIETGRVSVSALREATWMLALSSLATSRFRPQASVPIPPEIVPGRPRDGSTNMSLGLGGIFSTSWRREWSWLRPRKGILTGQASGEVVHGGPSYEANDHAQSLLAIADTTFVPGCAPGLAPSARGAVDWSNPGRRVYHPEDPPFDFDHPDFAGARMALAAAKMPSICAAIP